MKLVKRQVAGFAYQIVFARNLYDYGEKHHNPPDFPQKIGETGPQAGAKLSKKTQRSGFLTETIGPRRGR